MKVSDYTQEVLDEVLNYASNQKEEFRSRRKSFVDEVRRGLSRINSGLGKKPSLSEASDILKASWNRLGQYEFSEKGYNGMEGEASVGVARAYAAFFLGLKVMNNSPNEQSKQEVKYFLEDFSNGLIKNYKLINDLSKNYLGLRKAPISFVEKASRRSLESNFAYAPNKVSLREGLEHVGVDLSNSSSAKSLDSSLAILSLVGSLFFFSSNLTGHVVSGSSISNANSLGVFLLAISGIFGFFYLNRKRRVSLRDRIRISRAS